MAKAPKPQNWLVFVDTNIMLDFYRLPGESAERQLAGLARHQGSLIVTEQVRMEFLKHRQKVIIEGVQKIQKPSKLPVPMIVAGSQPAKSLGAAMDRAIETHRRVKERVNKILQDPATHDPVYQTLSKIFSADSQWNLKRPDKRRFEVRNAARKRFILGYPPRKSNDTSIGDALNWEWIIRCAKESNYNVLIVSRDSDYGITSGDTVILNDWLRTEFKARISRKRKIELTNKLTVALKRLDEIVAPEDEEAEEEVLQTRLRNWLLHRSFESERDATELRQWLEQFRKYPAANEDDSDM